MTVPPAVASAARFRGFRAFRHRNYRLFFAGQLVSLVGTWMQQIAQGWLVLELTGDPLWLGLVATAQFLPVILLGLFGGVLADHLPKRQTLLATQVVSMVLAFALFGLTASGSIQVWHIMVLAALLGTTNAVEMPTRQAFAIEIVGRDDIGNAVGLNAAIFNGARVFGPALAGLTIALFDISVAFLVNGITFLAVIGAYLLMHDDELRPAPAMARPDGVRGVFENLAEGLAYVRRTELVLLAIVVLALVATFGMNFQVLAPPLARNILNTDASGYGFLMAASGLGSLAAALSVAFARRQRPWAIPAGALALGVASLVLAVSRAYPLSLVAMFVAGAGGIGLAITANTTIQLRVPDQLRGRVMAIYTTAFAGSVPIGGLIMGAVASGFGVDVALAVGGAASLLVGAWAVARLRAISMRPSVGAPAATVPPAAVGESGSSGRLGAAGHR